MNYELYDADLEKQFLGMCLVDPNAFADSKLSVDDFGLVVHQLLFKAIATVFEEHGVTDTLLVAKQMERDGDLRQLDRIGGTVYLYDLQSVIIETESAQVYETEILRLSSKREFCRIMHKAEKQANDPSVEPEQLKAEVILALDEMSFHAQQLENYSGHELRTMEVTPARWFIPDMLSTGLTILAGPPKIGKSYFCWNIALAVAVGGVAFSSIELEKKHNVTYLSFEDSPALLKERFADLGDIYPANLHIAHDMHLKKFDAVGLNMLKTHIRETESEVVIIDTWAHVAPEIDMKGSAYDVDYRSLIPVQKFAERENIAMILVTHTRKAADIDNAFNQIQGSTGMQAGCDTLMMLSHDSGTKTLHISGRRIASEQYSFSVENGLWILEGKAEEFHQSELRKMIEKFLIQAGAVGLSTGDLIDLTGKKDSTVRLTLRRMLQAGQISQPKKRSNYFIDTDSEQDLFEL